MSVRGFAAALGERAGYAVSHGSVSHYESGTTVPAAYVEAVARAFTVSTEWLLTGRGPEDRVEPEAIERAFRRIAEVVDAARPRPPVLEAQLDAFFRLSPDLFCIMTPQGRLSRVNPAWDATLGRTDADLLDASIEALIHPDDREGFFASITALVAGRDVGTSVLCRMAAESGEYRWISWNSAASGGLVYAVGRDLTEQRRAHERLRAEHTVTRLLAETSRIEEVMAAILRVTGESLAWDAGAFWTPTRSSEAIGCTDFWAVPEIGESDFAKECGRLTFEPGRGLVGAVWASGQPDWVPDLATRRDYVRAESAARAGLRSACAFPVRVGDETFGVLEFYSRRAGEPAPELLATMLTIGSQIGQFRKRARAEDALRGERDLSTLILETVGVLVLVLDPEGRVIRMNSECERVTGYSTEDLFGRSIISTLVPPDETATVTSVLERLHDGESPMRARHHLVARDGSRHLLDWNCRTLVGRDGHIAYIVRAGVLADTDA